MNDRVATVAQLKELVLAFSVERDWVQFHHPKDLGIALGSEVGELLDLFRFRTDAAIAASLETDEGRRAVADELADCFWAVLRLAEVCRIDLAGALVAKVELAGRKYPAERSRGRNEKYTAYQGAESDDGPLP